MPGFNLRQAQESNDRANTEHCDRRGIAATLALLTVAAIQSLSAMISLGPHANVMKPAQYLQDFPVVGAGP
jgi:hypothetical protein